MSNGSCGAQLTSRIALLVVCFIVSVCSNFVLLNRVNGDDKVYQTILRCLNISDRNAVVGTNYNLSILLLQFESSSFTRY